MATLDQAVPSQPVNQPGNAAGTQPHTFRELGHPQLTVARQPQLDQNVELGQRHAVRGNQVRFQPAQDRGLSVQESTPGPHLGRFELRGHGNILPQPIVAL